MIADFVKDLDFLAPYLKEKLKADEEHTWENAPYIHEDVKRLIRKKKPSSKCIPSFYIPTFQSLNYCISSQTQSIDANMRMLQANIASQQMQSIESERNALLFSVSQEQQYEIIRKIIQEDNSEPDVLETTTLDDPFVRTYLR